MADRLSVLQKQILSRQHQSFSRTMASATKHSIAILDDYGDIAKKHFSSLSDLSVTSFPDTLNPASPEGLEALITRLKPFTIVSTMRERTPFPSSLLSQLPNLKLLLTTGPRNASLDMTAASKLSIPICGTAGVQPEHLAHCSGLAPPPNGFDSTTQHTWALLLSLCSRIPHDNTTLRTSPAAWQSGFSIPLGGRTLAVLGLGRLGANTARIASSAFGMNIIAWSENLTQAKADAAAENAGLPKGTFRAVSKEDLFREADVLSVHYVLSDRSRRIVSTSELALMKPTAVLVNTSRGPLVDETALLSALEQGLIRGAALDVWWQEPLPEDSVWRKYQGKGELVMSPHMGYVNEATMHCWYQEQAEIARRFLAGEELLNRLNEPVMQ